MKLYYFTPKAVNSRNQPYLWTYLHIPHWQPALWVSPRGHHRLVAFFRTHRQEILGVSLRVYRPYCTGFLAPIQTGSWDLHNPNSDCFWPNLNKNQSSWSWFKNFKQHDKMLVEKHMAVSEPPHTADESRCLEEPRQATGNYAADGGAVRPGLSVTSTDSQCHCNFLTWKPRAARGSQNSPVQAAYPWATAYSTGLTEHSPTRSKFSGESLL